MRLIDADAINQEMYHKAFEVDDGRQVWNSGLWIRYQIFDEAIRDAPTIDAVPVRKGKWIRTGRTNIYGGIELQCPFCNDRVMVSRVDHEIYCRHCGAKLGKEE